MRTQLGGELSPERKRRLASWGEFDPPPQVRTLRAGSMSADLVGATLDHVRWNGSEQLRSVFVAVRDRNWATVPGSVQDCVVHEKSDRIEVRLCVRHVSADVDFTWSGRYVLCADELTADMSGTVDKAFDRNRIGWCVLHPLELADTTVQISTPAGEILDAVFPDRVSAHQPLRDIRSLAYTNDELEVRVRLRFSGDTFETEDQRNWSDASYKTYGTPLSLPFPVHLRVGDEISQAVRLAIDGSAGPVRRPAPADDALDVRVGDPCGTSPQWGLAHSGRRLGSTELPLIRATSPDLLHVELDLDGTDWQSQLTAAADDAARLSTTLQVAAVTREPGRLKALAEAALSNEVPIGTLFVFDHRLHTTTKELAAAAELAFADRKTEIGGGSRAHFAELNRGRALPVDQLQVINFPITAQMHANDRSSVRETIATHSVLVRQAKEIAQGRPVTVGPIGFRPRFNDVATGETAATPPEALPDAVDPRQASVFGAAWTVAALAALSYAGADRLVLHETTGWRGLITEEHPPLAHPAFPAVAGEAFPVWHVLAALATMSDATLLSVQCPPPISALAVRRDDSALLLLANMNDTPARLHLRDLRDFRRSTLLAPDTGDPRGWSRRETTYGPDGQIELPAPSVAICDISFPVAQTTGAHR